MTRHISLTFHTCYPSSPHAFEMQMKDSGNGVDYNGAGADRRRCRVIKGEKKEVAHSERECL